MNSSFFKRNWLYIALLSVVILLNVASRIEMKKEVKEEKKMTEEKVEEEAPSPFVDFEEAQDRSKQIEKKLSKNPSLYVFYISLNLLLVFIFFIGLLIDGIFLLSKLRKKDIIVKTQESNIPPWTIGQVFKIIILSLAVGYGVFMLFAFLVGFLEGLLGTKFTFYKSENFRMIFDTVILDTIVLLVILRFLWNAHKRKLSSLGFSRERMRKNIFYGIVGYLGVIPITFTLGIIIYVILNIFKIKPPPQPIVGLFLVEKNTALIFASSLIAAMFGPIIEELFFRGVMYNAVKRKFGIFWGIMITSILFSFLHTHAMTYFIVGFIPIAVLGIILAYLYEKTGSLIPSIVLHMLNNIGSVFMVFVFKFFNSLIQK